MRPILYPPEERAFDSNGLGVLSDAASCQVTEERNGGYELTMQYPVFQSTPPVRGGDAYTTNKRAATNGFQSTPPARGATAKMHSFTCGSLTNK